MVVSINLSSPFLQRDSGFSLATVLSDFAVSRSHLIHAVHESKPALDRAVTRLLDDISATRKAWESIPVEPDGKEKEVIAEEFAILDSARSKAQLVHRFLANLHLVRTFSRRSLRKLEKEFRDGLRLIERLQSGVRKSAVRARDQQLRF